MENELSAADIESLKQAKDAKQQLDRLGLDKSIPQQEAAPEPDVPKTYENFIEIKGLPSKGYFYKEAIHGQPLVTSDMLLIQSLDEYNVDERYSEIFKRRTRGIDVNDILYADELFIAYWLRESSFPGNLWPHDGWRCEHCKLEIPSDKADFDFRSIKFNSNIDEIRELYGEHGYVEFELPDSKNMCKLHLKRRGHVARTKKALDLEYYNRGKVPQDYEIEMMEILSVVDIGIPGLKETYDEFIKLSANDFNEFLKNIKKYSLNSEVGVQFTCPQCQEGTSLMEYPFRKEIYFPGHT